MTRAFYGALQQTGLKKITNVETVTKDCDKQWEKKSGQTFMNLKTMLVRLGHIERNTTLACMREVDFELKVCDSNFAVKCSKFKRRYT